MLARARSAAGARPATGWPTGSPSAAESTADVPFVGDGLSDPLDAAAGAGSALARAGVAQQEAVALLALLLALLLAGMPDRLGGAALAARPARLVARGRRGGRAER